MRKKKTIIEQNGLEQTPCRNVAISWKADKQGKITLEIENKGVFHRIAQTLFHKPKISYVHLDTMGSFIWPLIDGKTDIIALGKAVEEHFGDEAQPLYERLTKYFQILESYGFVTWNKQ